MHLREKHGREGLCPGQSPFYASPPKRAGFLLGYASLTEADIAEGIRRLATAL